MTKCTWGILAISLILVGCFNDTGKNDSSVSGQPQGNPATRESLAEGSQFRDQLLEIAATYPTYTEISTWLPKYPANPVPVELGFSQSIDSTTHGRKPYRLFIKQVLPKWGGVAALYKFFDNPVGQVLVHEIWHSEALSMNGSLRSSDEHGFTAFRRNRIYETTEKAGIFIMFKLESSAADTDNGWVYGSVAPDSRMVLAAGRIRACMECHEKALPDRLFGVMQENLD